jgi:hypothetical protein
MVKNMERKEEFIGEIRNHLSEAGTPTRQKPLTRNRRFNAHRTRTLGKITPIGGALLIASMIATASLLGFLWTSYTVTIEGDISVNGSQGEICELYVDGIICSGTSLTITSMDVSTLNPGDDITVTHHIINGNGHEYGFAIDLSQMPLNYVDPEALWYGLSIKSYETGTTNELTTFTVPPETNYDFDINYAVDVLFADPQQEFPFIMVLDIEAQDTTPIPIDDSYSFDNIAPLTVVAPGVLSNDVNPGTGDMTAELETDVTHGILILNTDGGFTYTPEAGYTGQDTFTYNIFIGEVQSLIPGTVTITVLAHDNTPPLAQNDETTITDHLHHDIYVMENDIDDGYPQPLTITEATAFGTHVFVTNHGTHLEVWTDATWSLDRSITYTVSDGEFTSSATLFVHIVI